MDEEIYDEFGNYIGPDISGIENNCIDDDDIDYNQQNNEDVLISNEVKVTNDKYKLSNNNNKLDTSENANNDVVLLEDKNFYKSADEVYPGVETLVMDEDDQPITKPIIDPVGLKTFEDTGNYEVNFDKQYLLDLMHIPELCRNIAVSGALHHGKTSFIDLLINSTHSLDSNKANKDNKKEFDNRKTRNMDLKLFSSIKNKNTRFLDNRKDEQIKELSIKCSPISLILKNSNKKSYLLNIIDTPGHPNFNDEVSSAFSLVDGLLFVVDAVEGIMEHSKIILLEAIKNNLDIILCINKIDRLILEMKIPPNDMYFKIKSIIDDFNVLIEEYLIYSPIVNNNNNNSNTNINNIRYVCPKKGNVLFSSSKYNMIFSLSTFADYYLSINLSNCINLSDYGIKKGNYIANNIKENNNIFSKLTSNENNQVKLKKDALINLLWGDIYFDDINKYFTSKKSEIDNVEDINKSRTFVEFILEPIYKIIGYSVSLNTNELSLFIKKLNLELNKSDYNKDTKDLLNLICGKLFGDIRTLVDSIVNNIIPTNQGNIRKINDNYTGNRNCKLFEKLCKNESEINNSLMDINNFIDKENFINLGSKTIKSTKPLLLHISKLYYNEDNKNFFCFGRVLSGTISKGDILKILGERYNILDNEDKNYKDVQELYINQTRYKININKVPEGNFVLIEGIDEFINKSATITLAEYEYNLNSFEFNIQDLQIMKPISFSNFPYFKVSIEPYNPSDLPKMVEAISKIIKSYPLSRVKVETSGEHIIYGTGELYLDCILHDIRNIYSNIEIRVSDPVVCFSETVAETSITKSQAQSTNAKNNISMICEPLDENMCNDIELFNLNIEFNDQQLKNPNASIDSSTTLGELLTHDYNWDEYTLNNIWSFSSASLDSVYNNQTFSKGCNNINILTNYTLPFKTNQDNLNTVKPNIIKGFNWSCLEGPLCEEPIRGVNFKLLDANISENIVYKAVGQIMPMSRRACSSSILLASPRLLEPILTAEILCPVDCIPAITSILNRRRGHINTELAKGGTPFYVLNISIPALDSFGFETDVRSTTAGLAMVLTWFDKWEIIPGNPLDRSIVVKNLEISDAPRLAREVFIKTRRRKGLMEDINIAKYFDDKQLIEEIAKNKDLIHYFN